MEIYGSDQALVAVNLPPGFRFHPTDEEIILHYLLKKVSDPRFVARAIGEVDLNKCEPWDLPKKAKSGEKVWFFFCQKDRKYPTGMRTNRATESGYWKATGKDKEVYKDKKCVIGMKKTLVFYKGRAPKGEKTDWVIHEYRLEPKFTGLHFSRTAAKDDWVVCKVFDKSLGMKRITSTAQGMGIWMDHLWDSPVLPPPFADYSSSNFVKEQKTGTINSPFSSIPQPNLCSFPQISTIQKRVLPCSALGYRSRLGLITSAYPTDASNYPKSSLRLMTPPLMNTNSTSDIMELQFSSNNSMVISGSQDTVFNTTEIVNEIDSVVLDRGLEQNVTIFDEELDGLAFSPDISDLDCLWC